MRGRLWAIVGMVALAGAGALLAAVPLNAKSAKSAATLPTGNLVLNPGAEAGLTGWTTFYAPAFKAVSYGAPGGFPGTSVATKIGGEGRFFWAGQPGNTDEHGISQLIDVSPWSAEIDVGNVAVRLSADVGGYLTDTDSGYVLVKDQTHTAFPAKVGPVTPAQRNNLTDLIPLSATGDLLPGTHSISVALIGQLKQGGDADAYFDNISVQLISKTAPTTSSTTTTGATTPSTTSSPGTTNATTTSTSSTTTVTKTVTTTTPTTPGSPGTTTATTSSPPPPPLKTTPAKASLSLACSKTKKKTLIAALKPAKGTKLSSVWFYVNGKLKMKDRKAPFVAAIPTKGLSLPLRVTAAIQASGKSTFLRQQFRGC
jgi:hypothetical protein